MHIYHLKIVKEAKGYLRERNSRERKGEGSKDPKTHCQECCCCFGTGQVNMEQGERGTEKRLLSTIPHSLLIWPNTTLPSTLNCHIGYLYFLFNVHMPKLYPSRCVWLCWCEEIMKEKIYVLDDGRKVCTRCGEWGAWREHTGGNTLFMSSIVYGDHFVSLIIF